MRSICEYLSPLPYPGRTIFVGNLKDGTPVIAYALMGRSKNSQNRVLAVEDGKVAAKLFKKEKAGDTEWILYDAVLASKDDKVVVSNGTQTTNIQHALDNGIALEDCLMELTYEGDGIATPRIAAILDNEANKYTLLEIKKDGDKTARIVWNYTPCNGYGRIIHTYTGDGNTETFNTDPILLSVPECEDDDLIDLIWDSLDAKNRISLLVMIGDEGYIINKNEERRYRVLDRPLERKNWRLYGPETNGRKIMNAQRAQMAKLARVSVPE